MAAIEMDGKALAARIKESVRTRVEEMPHKPGLAQVLIGYDQAARVYAEGKKRDCALCGIYNEEIILQSDVTQRELLSQIAVLNARDEIDGILVQFPLPEHLDPREVQLAIRPDKDVDCVHPANMGYLMLGGGELPPLYPGGRDAPAGGLPH